MFDFYHLSILSFVVVKVSETCKLYPPIIQFSSDSSIFIIDPLEICDYAEILVWLN